MAVYAIGDIQGCFDELQQLLAQLKFNRENDQLWFCGDLVNRGPKSLETLRFVKDLGQSAITVLGNHDLHLLAVLEGHGKYLANDTLDDLIHAPDREALINWLRQQKVMHYDAQLGYAMVHAGLPPQWNLQQALACADELHAMLRGDNYLDFVRQMYGNEPKRWDDSLTGIDRLRFITNCFSRLRFCKQDGKLNLKDKGGPGSQKKGIPWFEVSNRRSRATRIIFGHWSTLPVGEHDNCYALDGGCLWGGKLVAMRLDSAKPEWHSLDCAGACTPG